MAEKKKRFDCFESTWGSKTITDTGKCIGAETVVDLLNDLNDENEQLKKEGLYWSQNAEARKKEINRIKKENEQLKKELKKYTDAFDCSQCRFQNYDWFDDGDEFEVCEKGNNEAQMENHSCSEWEEI